MTAEETAYREGEPIGERCLAPFANRFTAPLCFLCGSAWRMETETERALLRKPGPVSPHVEHVNITVRSIERAVAFLRTALPDFRVRGQGEGEDRKWLHLGTAQSYLALEEPLRSGRGRRTPYVDSGINHVGLVVDDAEAVRRRLREAGYREGIRVPRHPARHRIYFFDDDGIEYEFIEYTSNDPRARNEYDAPTLD